MKTDRLSFETILFLLKSYTSIPLFTFPKTYASPFYLFKNTFKLVPEKLRFPTGYRLVFNAFSYLIPSSIVTFNLKTF